MNKINAKKSENHKDDDQFLQAADESSDSEGEAANGKTFIGDQGPGTHYRSSSAVSNTIKHR